MNPGNEPPEIPSFKPPTGQGDEKKGGGMVPSSAKPAPSSGGFKFPGFGGGSTGASKALSAPNLKVRGLGGGGATVMDRLKNLRKKDLIFIGAGLCTLGMAPLAEHLLMSPDEQSAKLQEGFNSQQGPLFQDGSSVYEPGNGVGSPGGLVGQGQDVITPLNVRDPSNLIMSPGAQKKADAVASAAPPPPSAAPAKESDWKDVLRDSAKSGAGKAAAAAPRPRPNVGKMAGAIRGLSALGGGGGGTGASLKLDPLSARGVPNTAAGSNALTRSQATPGFRGATSRSGASSGAGEDLRAAGARQSDIFNKGGGASAALDAASREAIPTGGAGSGGGRPGEGGETKNPGGNSHKDNKSLGESLAFLRQKMEMEKSLDLKWERKKWNEFGRQKMMEESALKLGFDMFGKFAEKAFIGPLGDMVGQAVAGSTDQVGWECEFPLGSGQKRKFPKSGAPGWKWAGGFFNNEQGTPVTGACTKAVLGANDSGGAPPNPNADGKTPSRVGPVAEDRAGQAKSKMDALYTAQCSKPGESGQLDAGNCTSLDTIRKIASQDLLAIQTHKENAHQFIAQGYGKLKESVSFLEKGHNSLSATIGSGKDQAKAPMPKIEKAAADAKTELAAQKNEPAKLKLDGGKTDGLDAAIGSNATPDCAKPGGTMSDGCSMRQLSVDAVAAARDAFVNAEKELTNAFTRIGTAETDLMKIVPAPNTQAINGRIVTDARDEVKQRLSGPGGLKDDVVKYGAAPAGAAPGYLATARNVMDSKVEKLRADVYGPPTAPGGAYDLTLKAVKAGADVVNLPAGATWMKAADPAVIAAAAAAQPAQAPEAYAASQNAPTLEAVVQPLTPAITAARGSIETIAPQVPQLKQSVDGCMKTFVCTP